MPTILVFIFIVSALILIPLFGCLMQDDKTPFLRGAGNSYATVGVTSMILAILFGTLGPSPVSDSVQVLAIFGFMITALGGALLTVVALRSKKLDDFRH